MHFIRDMFKTIFLELIYQNNEYQCLVILILETCLRTCPYLINSFLQQRDAFFIPNADVDFVIADEIFERF